MLYLSCYQYINILITQYSSLFYIKYNILHYMYHVLYTICIIYYYILYNSMCIYIYIHNLYWTLYIKDTKKPILKLMLFPHLEKAARERLSSQFNQASIWTSAGCSFSQIQPPLLPNVFMTRCIMCLLQVIPLVRLRLLSPIRRKELSVAVQLNPQTSMSSYQHLEVSYRENSHELRVPRCQSSISAHVAIVSLGIFSSPN